MVIGLLDIGTNYRRHLHHIDGFTFFKISEIRHFTGFACGVGIFKNGINYPLLGGGGESILFSSEKNVGNDVGNFVGSRETLKINLSLSYI